MNRIVEGAKANYVYIGYRNKERSGKTVYLTNRASLRPIVVIT